ncbi:MAG: alpha/beta fold hydrolase [Bacteroidia bacterium]|nr:alpha/beta fold hydrolase [Bacteroidia bacterium]
MFLDFFLFHPTKLSREHVFSFPVPFTEYFLKTPDGAEINVLWFHSPQPRGLILYFHGNADDLSRWGKMAEDFLHLNYDVMMMDYRGFGKSTGKLSESILHADGKIFYNHALQHFPAEKIVIYGRSLGTGIATRLAAEVPSAQLILETPFYNLPELLLRYIPFIGSKIPWAYQFRSDEYIQQVKVPLTIFHGTEDEVVPYKEGKKFEALLGERVRFVTLHGGKHKNLSEYPLYHEVLAEVLG